MLLILWKMGHLFLGFRFLCSVFCLVVVVVVDYVVLFERYSFFWPKKDI
jgi:hypothetical protein